MCLRSYLSNRKFFVKHGEKVTNLFQIKAGVPQGSVLGPILYLLFTYDLPISNNVVIGTFADDTAILASACNATSASHKLQESLNEITQWLNEWRIKPNVNKSVQVTFTTRRDTCPTVTLNDIEISQSSSTKYLGIHLDRKLT